jgi:integrase
MKSDHLRLVESSVMRPVASKGRKANATYRVREHLTKQEVSKLLAALKTNRHGQRDSVIGLVIYRHGLRVSEACDLRWDDLDLPKRTIRIRRLKGSQDSSHYLERDEVAGLKALQRLYAAQGSGSSYVFVNERGQPFNRMGIARGRESRQAALCSARPHAQAQHRVRAGQPRQWIPGGYSIS